MYKIGEEMGGGLGGLECRLGTRMDGWTKGCSTAKKGCLHACQLYIHEEVVRIRLDVCAHEWVLHIQIQGG